eukprot:980139-Rhodomonas_salina.1
MPCCYALATPYPVLTGAMLLPGDSGREEGDKSRATTRTTGLYYSSPPTLSPYAYRPRTINVLQVPSYRLLCAVRYWPGVWCYAVCASNAAALLNAPRSAPYPPTPILCAVQYQLGHTATLVLCGLILLRACYGLSSTELGNGSMHCL